MNYGEIFLLYFLKWYALVGVTGGETTEKNPRSPPQADSGVRVAPHWQWSCTGWAWALPRGVSAPGAAAAWLCTSHRSWRAQLQAGVQQGPFRAPRELQGLCPSSAALPALPGLGLTLFPHSCAAFHPLWSTRCPQGVPSPAEAQRCPGSPQCQTLAGTPRAAGKTSSCTRGTWWEQQQPTVLLNTQPTRAQKANINPRKTCQSITKGYFLAWPTQYRYLPRARPPRCSPFSAFTKNTTPIHVFFPWYYNSFHKPDSQAHHTQKKDTSGEVRESWKPCEYRLQ